MEGRQTDRAVIQLGAAARNRLVAHREAREGTDSPLQEGILVVEEDILAGLLRTVEGVHHIHPHVQLVPWQPLS